jgi:hypothetical protein
MFPAAWNPRPEKKTRQKCGRLFKLYATPAENPPPAFRKEAGEVSEIFLRPGIEAGARDFAPSAWSKIDEHKAKEDKQVLSVSHNFWPECTKFWPNKP